MDMRETLPGLVGDDEVLGLRQAAEALGIRVATLRRLLREHHVPVVRLGWRTVRIRRADLATLVLQLRGPVGEGGRAQMQRRKAQATQRDPVRHPRR
jgi:excisionase family DNA binding protein